MPVFSYKLGTSEGSFVEPWHTIKARNAAAAVERIYHDWGMIPAAVEPGDRTGPTKDELDADQARQELAAAARYDAYAMSPQPDDSDEEVADW